MPLIEVTLPVAARCRRATGGASDRSNSRCGGFLYTVFAEAFCAFSGDRFCDPVAFGAAEKQTTLQAYC
jgi:hypothetical protein